MTGPDHALYGLLWLSFGALHSVLASGTAKRFTQGIFGGRDRLAYNAVALLHVGLVWAMGAFALGGREVARFDIPAPIQGILWGSLVVGILTLLAAYRQYDGGRFTGFRVVASTEGAEPLQTGGLHRYVRHPLYTGAFLILIGQVSDSFSLATCAWASLYLVIGTGFEERRLISLYGPAYLAYRGRVPAFIPWKGRALR